MPIFYIDEIYDSDFFLHLDYVVFIDWVDVLQAFRRSEVVRIWGPSSWHSQANIAVFNLVSAWPLGSTRVSNTTPVHAFIFVKYGSRFPPTIACRKHNDVKMKAMGQRRKCFLFGCLNDTPWNSTQHWVQLSV